ncbi:MAG: hypothetical protein KBS75_06355, partial [Bacteroidales bacterium]|nr:hypothetical protein [Candidatus Equimonas faecalis]
MKIKHILLTVLCTMTLGLQAQERTFTRNKVLVEKHTGIYCPACGPADTDYSNFMRNHPNYADKVVLMRHNSFSSDNLQIASLHKQLSTKWGVSSFPTYLIDRCSTDGTQSPRPQDYHCSYGNWSKSGWDGIGKRLAKPTYVSLSLEGSAYDPATGKITVQAHGEVTKDVPDLSICVFLTQDSVGGNTDHAYSKSSRAFLTDNIHGDKLTVKDGWYEYTKEYTLEDTYGRCAPDPSKMNLVVFVSSYDDYNFTNSEVHNADEVRITTLPKTVPARCATPSISLKDGKLDFSCATEGASFNYTLSPIPATTTTGNVSCADVAFKVTAVAKAENHASSKPAIATYTLADVQASFTPKESPIVFVNPCDGMEYADGETMIITPVIEYDWCTFPAPSLRNKSAEAVNATLQYTIDMPHGSFMECLNGDLCNVIQTNGTYTSAGFTIPASEDIDTKCEWECMSETTWACEPGTCTTQFTVYVDGEPAGSCTVEYIYSTEAVLTQTIGSARYATLYADRALSVPEGLTAYTATEGDDRLYTTAIIDGVIPARTGVILEGNANTYDFYTAPNLGTADRGCLKGVLADTTNPGGCYVLSQVKGSVGFYRLGDGVTLKANRAYYQPTAAGANAFLLDILGNGTTDISLTKSPLKGDLE